MSLLEKLLGKKISEDYFPEVYKLFKKEGLEPPRVKLKDNFPDANNRLFYVVLNRDFKSFSTEKVFSILLHEKGHSIYQFLFFGLLLAIYFLTILYGIILFLINPSLIYLISIVMARLTFPYLIKKIKIWTEYRADKFAAKHLKNKKIIVEIIQEIRDNKKSRIKGLKKYFYLLIFGFYKFLFYPWHKTHPTIKERKENILEN